MRTHRGMLPPRASQRTVPPVKSPHLAALLSLFLARRLPHAGRHRRRRNMASMRSAAPARWRECPPEPATSPCSTRREQPIRARSTSPRAITDVRATCQDVGRPTWSRPRPSPSPRMRRDPSPARQVVLPYFDVALQRRSRRSPPSRSARPCSISPPATSTAGPGSRPRCGSTAPPRPCPNRPPDR